MTSIAHATWLHACPASQTAAGRLSTVVTKADGTQAQFVINDQPELFGCRGMQLPATESEIEALHPLAPKEDIGNIILLQGVQNDGRFSITGHEIPNTKPQSVQPAPRTPMPIHANLLPAMQTQSFGIEERVHVQLKEGHLELECTGGRKPAGVILTGPWYMPHAEAAIRTSFTGNGTFELQAVDAVRASAQTGLTMGRISARSSTQMAQIDLPHGLDRSTWKHLIIVCPLQEANLQLNILELAGSANKAMPRSTWVWDTRQWQRDAESLLTWAREKGISELFIAVPVDGDAVRNAAALATFVQQASGYGIAVWSVDGDPQMVLPAEHAATVQRARAYANYNARVEPTAQLHGVQFDIEPYLLAGYNTAPAEWDRRYLELAHALRGATRGMQLEFVVPYWWANKQELLHELTPSLDSLAVMNYRTNPDEIYRFAVPFLDWASKSGKRVHIALEAGPIASETQKRYTRVGKGKAGEILLLKMEGAAVLVLLKEARESPNLEAFHLESSIVFDGSATTFHADKQRLERLLPRLEKDFNAWSGFGGIALHEFR